MWTARYKADRGGPRRGGAPWRFRGESSGLRACAGAGAGLARTGLRLSCAAAVGGPGGGGTPGARGQAKANRPFAARSIDREGSPAAPDPGLSLSLSAQRAAPVHGADACDRLSLRAAVLAPHPDCLVL